MVYVSCFVNQVRSNNYREAITIPVRSWTRFRDVITEMIDKVDVVKEEVRVETHDSETRESPRDAPPREPAREVPRETAHETPRETPRDRGAAGEPEADEKIGQYVDRV